MNGFNAAFNWSLSVSIISPAANALDPAIIASSMSLADINNDIDLKEIINKTKYGKEGIGGIITKGTMYRGYPR